MPLTPPAYPMKLVPKLLAKPWGGRRIETVLGRRLQVAGPVGESWEVYDRGGDSSEIANGPLAGRRLADLRGDRPFPLLVKLLDAGEELSVQVHPDADAARRLGGEEKSECWFVVHAEPGAKVSRGLVDGCTREDLVDALAAGDVASKLRSFEVAAGDTIYVPAGTVHTIGAGVLLVEVQQNSDTTYRLHDWGRGRELHVREALESVRFGVRSPDKAPVQVLEDDGGVRRELLVTCRHFAAECHVATGTFTLDLSPSSVPLQPFHVLAGAGEIRTFRRGVEPVPFAAGDTLLLPAEYESYEVAAGASVVRAIAFRA
jgi:mannose-6-phosphate isomerase